MDIAALQTFVAVAETGSFSQAAERLFLTQPAISKRVAGLEDELRARLFDRVGRLVALTEAGAALLPRARRILAEVEDSQRVISNLSGQVGGRLGLGTSHHIGLHRLPPVLRRFMEDYPAVSLDLRFLDSETALREVEHGDLDMALVTLPENPSPVLEIVPLWPDPLLFVAGPEHPLTKRSIQPADLQIIDAAGLAVLEKSLADPNAGVVVLALNHLERLDPGAIERHLPALLNHAQPGVRRDVMTRIERLQIVSALPLLRAQIADELALAKRPDLVGA